MGNCAQCLKETYSSIIVTQDKHGIRAYYQCNDCCTSATSPSATAVKTSNAFKGPGGYSGPFKDDFYSNAKLQAVQEALAITDGNQVQAARVLGVNRSTIHRILNGRSKAANAIHNS